MTARPIHGYKQAIPIGLSVLGQVPPITTVTTILPVMSLYQPAIYRGREAFLLVALMVGIMATWAVSIRE